MQQSITSGSSSSRDGIVHKESVFVPGENLLVPGSYRPSDGSWDEFKGDVRAFFVRLGDDISDRYDDLRESANRVLHRKNASAS